jgi:hypothetical protein
MLGLALSAVHPNESTQLKKKRGRPSKAEMALKQQDQHQQKNIVESEDEDGEVYEVEAIKGMRLTQV